MRTWSPALLVLAACGGAAPAPAPVPDKPIVVTTLPAPPAPPPPAGPRRGDDVDELHGVKVADPYRWLEDATAPEVQAWMAKQDAATRARLAAVPTRAALKGRLEELWYYDLVGAPEHRAGRYFWTQRHKDKEKRVAYWKQGESGAPQVMFDPNTWSDDGSIALGGWAASWDGRLVAYMVRKNNSDEATLRIRDVATGKDLDDVIEGAKYAWPSWLPDSSGFYYTWVPPISAEVTVELRPGKAELRFHRIGTPPASDAVVYPATGDPRIFINGGVSRDGRWLIASLSRGWSSNDIYLQDRRAARPAWVPLVTGTDHNYAVTAWKDTLYVTTDEGAPRYRVMAVDPRRPARKHWKEIVAQADATLEHTKIIGNRLVLSYMRNATTAIEIRRLDGRLVREVALPGLGSAWLYGRADEDTAFLSYGDFVTPARILRTSIASGKTAEWSRVTLPIDPSFIESEQVWYPSKDGTRVSMFLVRRKGQARTGATPVILYGYGGFGVSETPYFSSAWAAWLEMGGMVAIPNLRGGGEYGEAWHEAGMLLAKQNVFDDFLAAARYLIAEKWTSPAKLAIYGGSNGGLLVGAAMTQAPELFGAVVCAVPLLDMVRYHRSGSGRTWIHEYGSADDPAQFQALLAYSPYHRVAPGTAYPPLLMLSADSDDRVDPMHARKFTAAIQHASSSKAPVLLRVEKNAGHGGADLVRQSIEKHADMFAFLAQALHM
jgi:prolyl oligopeptidase